ncbi:hypothetical protein KY348_06795 [Candidatus Woesearchaeota archaeon]|nr:hypothetical protein [Candidatus Woesearchaeota archaeon]
MKEETLLELGLTEKEVKVYIALLQLGSATVQEVSSKANTYRTYTYEILNSLQHKGFVTYVIKSGKKYFEAPHPRKIIELLKEKQEKAERILPELEGIYKTTLKKPSIEVFEKKEGLKTLMWYSLAERKDLSIPKENVFIGNFDNFNKYFAYFSDLLIKERVKKKIPFRYVIDDSEESKRLTRNNKKVLRETKMFSELRKSKAEIGVHNDIMMIFTLVEDEPIGIKIQDKELTKLFRIIFDIIWGKGK